ncbi:MAG: magnesium chelatase domain-containing protein [Faecalibacterium prausnitzii]
MYSVTNSFGLNGLRGFAVAVEADVSGGLPAFSIVGLPDSAVRESADRVRAAIKNLGFRFPDRRITINLAPADVRKTGPVYDLPLLLALLTASGQLEEVPADAAFLGELALDGSLRPVSGVLPMALGRCRARHPGAVRSCRERRRGSRGLCRHHDRLSRPHRPGGSGGAEGHPPPLPCRRHPL